MNLVTYIQSVLKLIMKYGNKFYCYKMKNIWKNGFRLTLKYILTLNRNGHYELKLYSLPCPNLSPLSLRFLFAIKFIKWDIY